MRFSTTSQQNVKRAVLGLSVAALGLVPLGALAQTPQPGAATFADPAFERTWQRTDKPVADGTVKRGFYWGPGPFDTRHEQYVEGQTGKRLVQYFDKSRMEINNPEGDKNSPFYVTNGLLTVELVSGRMQTGNNSFADRTPANIPLASDNDDPNAPTYASFARLLTGTEDRTNQNATGLVDKAGNVTQDAALGNTAGAKLVYYEPQTRHNIPQVFWDFLNVRGPVFENGGVLTKQISEPWFYASGLPITEPYWARVKIAGKADTLVLVQLYERRVLTYVPSEPQPEFRVQVGNIGRHYHDWRYGEQSGPGVAPPPLPTAPGMPTIPLPVRTTQPTVPPASNLSVFAASSLKESFDEMGRKFKAANPNLRELSFNFQGSQALVTQLQQGAPADVFASADKANMDKAVSAGLTSGSPQPLARNLLVVVLPNENFGNISSLKDLAKSGIKLSLADPGVPVGKYSLEVLDKLSADPAYGAAFKQAVLKNVVSRENNVRQVLSRVQLGEVDAGIVYVTDARAANASASNSVPPVKLLAIPEKYNVVATYYVAAVKEAPSPGAGRAFISYALSSEGQAILEKYGFSRASTTRP
ncbi:MAG: molybdate ABC transporter substrate-binding protein [Chloroflexota bacterium]|nr:molybdate ABC transporter substrate-binding protein [Chloroflexota bacterium]MDQ5865806.1 molybdate ABC transporter substrate-binding protein [Chloroflexota bacterium]